MVLGETIQPVFPQQGGGCCDQTDKENIRKVLGWVRGVHKSDLGRVELGAFDIPEER